MTLQEMRKAVGLSQSNVAEKVGDTTQGAVSQWEKGDSYPKTPKLTALAKLYKVPERDIIEAIGNAKLDIEQINPKEHP